MKDYANVPRKELVAKLQEQEHLASAIEAKDAEINSLKQNIEVLADEKLKSIKEGYEKEIENRKKENEGLKLLLSRRSGELNELLILHGDLLKTLESATNSHLSLNHYIVDKITKE